MDSIVSLGPLTMSLLLTASFTGSFITAAFGIGGGLVTLAAIASLLPTPAIIPVHGAIQIGSNSGRLAIMFRSFHGATFLPFAIGAIIGAVIGGAFVIELDPAILRIVLGAFIIWSILFKPPKFLSKSPSLVGVTSSFLSMFIGGTGPFVVTYIKTLELKRRELVATHAGFMTLQHSLKTLVFFALGFAFYDWAAFIFLMILAGFLGTYLGRGVLMKINEVAFKKVLNIILALLAVRLILTGILSL